MLTKNINYSKNINHKDRKITLYEKGGIFTDSYTIEDQVMIWSST